MFGIQFMQKQVNIFRYWNCFLPYVLTNDEDGNGLKLNSWTNIFQVLMLYLQK